MTKLKSFRTKYFSYTIQDNKQCYTITQNTAGGIDSKTLLFQYGTNEDTIIQTFNKYN